MSNFFSRLFGSKKKSTKAVSRRLELLGLEERITPTVYASFDSSTGTLLIQSDNSDTFSVSSNAAGVSTITGATVFALNGSVDVHLITGGYTVTVNSGASNVKIISLTDSSSTTANQSITLSGINSTAFNDNFGISFALGNGNDTLNLGGSIALKGTGTLIADTSVASIGIDKINLGSGSELTLTSASGAISLAPAGSSSSGSFINNISLSNNATINSNSGDVTLGGIVPIAGGGKNLTINSGSGKTTINNTINALGNLTFTSTNATVFPTGSAISLAAVTAGAISLTGAGDISVSGAISAASVNAKSTAGDVIFADTVTTTQVGGFTSEATLSNKATKIANLVSVGAGASALITGNLITTGNNTVNVSPAYVLTQTGPGITVTGTGAISITGKVDALASTNDLYLTAVNGAINITGAVGSGLALDQLFVDGLGSFAANGSITANTLGVGFLTSSSFATSISFADAVKVTGANYDYKIPNDNNLLSALALEVVATGAGTVSFSKTIEASNAAATVYLQSQNGNIQVDGTITSKNGLSIYATGSGFVTLNDNVTTDQANGQVIISSNTGGISTKGVTTSGALANINIDTDTSGDIIIGGNISTSGGGDILLGADAAVLPPYIAYGTGNLTINGTVSTTGSSSTSGDIAIGSGGTGTITVNKALSTGTATNAGSIYILALGNQMNTINFSKDAAITSANIINFRTTGSTNTINFVSGANITSAGDVTDSYSGPGNINFAGNITTSNGLISFSDVSVNLTGPVSMKAGGQAGNINLGNTNGTQNLTLETTGNIVASSSTAIGGLTPLNSLTVVNSANSVFQNLNSANVTISDTTGFIGFDGNTVISKSLTTTTEGYDVSFASSKTAVISGAPVFLNTGNVIMQGTTSLPGGATITGGPSTNANLAGTIVSGGAFNIGSGISSINISDNTQLILNSTTAASTFASPISLNAQQAGTFKLLGVGTLTLSADSTTGVTTNDSIEVTNGTLNVTGKIPAATSLTNGTISGAGGTIGALNTTIGNVTPGGKLTTGAITLGAATNYNVSITGSTTASSLETAAAISLGSAVLNLTSVASGLKVGNQLTIIRNTVAGSGNPIVGTFANLPEGSTFGAKDAVGNTVFFSISYKGTDGINGNDAVLTVVGLQTLPLQPMVAGQPVLNKFTAFGADAGGGPLVTITFANGTYTSFFAYDPAFRGGVRVALGDVNADGTPEVITGAGPGGGPQVNVYSVNTLSGAVSLQSSFYAFSAPNFTGGVYVAAGRTNSDSFDDVIVGAGATGGPRVQVYAGSASGVVSSSTLNDFFAYSLDFTGGVVVAVGDRNADGDDEVITGPASNGGYNVKSFNTNGTGNNPTLVDNFFAFNNTTAVGGLSLAVGYLNTGAIADLVIGTTNGGYGVIIDSQTFDFAGVPFLGFAGIIRAGVAEDSTGKDYAVALQGPAGETGSTRVEVFSVGATSLTETDNLFVMNPGFQGGLFGTPTLPRNFR